ncbi:MAG TPA: sulfatase-like hydrolase/transferase [Polyangiaceae bacterium]
MRFRVALVSVALLAGAAACRDEERETRPVASANPLPAVPAAALGGGSDQISLLELLDTCDVSHRGLSIDVGSPASQTQRIFSQSFEKDVTPLRHGGGSFAEIASRSVDYQFYLSAPLDALHVSLRVRGKRAGHLAVYVDGKRLGSAKLARDEARVVSFKLSSAPLASGRHQVGLRLSAGERGSEGAYAEIEWLRLTSPEEADDQYAAPTAKDIVSDVVLEKRPRRSIALRDQSTVRCPLWPSSDTRLKSWLGFWGEGSGRAELRVVRPGGDVVTLEQRQIEGGETAGWSAIDVPLGRFAGELIALEFAVRDASGVGRVAFGDPALVRARAEAARVPPTASVVLVVMSGLRRASVPPWGSVAQLPGFAELVRAGTTFTNFRAPSSVPGAVLASMLTGVSPRVHSLEDPAARLPLAVHTINEAFKQASGHAAMFTGVPTSFPAFGFDRSWDAHQTVSPVSDEPAHAPFTLAEAWLKRDVEAAPEARRFLLIHARGVHPPWDVPKEEAALMKPEEYDGVVDARRGGISLGSLRSHAKGTRRLSTDDWTRLRALELAALKKQDAAFAHLAKTLQTLGLWENALVMVAGDVAAGEPPAIPYHPAGPLDEGRLNVPLLVKFPGRALVGKEVSVPVTAVDVAQTVLTALSLEAPELIEGEDLFGLAAGRLPLGGRPLWATLGPHFATRVGPWRLSGQLGATPHLCELGVDPACVDNLFDARAFIANSLWKWTYLAEQAARSKPLATREPASVDAETSAALAVWGDVQ